MVRWSAAREGKILVSLFENRLADPTHSKPTEIDPIKELKPEFKEFTKDQFRRNYCKTATKYVAGKAVEGTRFKNLELDKKDVEPEQLEQDLIEDSEDEEENQMIMPTAPIKQKQPVTAARSSYNNYQYKDDEIRWDAVYQSSKYISKGFHRDEIIIEPPASFDGAEGTYQVAFENDNRVLVVKIAPNPVLSDPHSINSFYAKMYGIMTADDSARHQAFKQSAKTISDKWYTFRYHLDWPGKPSEDLGLVPWLDYADIESEGRVFPLIIINLSSIRPIEERAKKMSARLVKKAFKSPAKVQGVNMAGDRTAQMAAMLEDMINNGTMTPEMKKAARKFGLDPDAMVDDTENSNKRHHADQSSIASNGLYTNAATEWN